MTAIEALPVLMLYGLYKLCQNPEGKTGGGWARQFKERSLMSEDGVIYDHVKAVVLSAVEVGDEFITVDSPVRGDE
jgi:hypothetical protein